MKKVAFALVVLMLVALAATAAADSGDNPNSFELDMNCEGETVHVTLPSVHACGGHVEGGGVACPMTHYIDFDFDGLFEADELIGAVPRNGGPQTTWCTWTWGNDPFTHGMDIQFVPPE